MADGFFKSIEHWPLSKAIAEGQWYFPAVETLHVVAISTVVGAILLLDLRLLGVRGCAVAVTRLAQDLLPWVWGAFAIAAVTGLAMFISSADRYAENGFFRAKLVLIALAGLNMAVFHLSAFKTVGAWDTTLPTPLPAKVAGRLSMALWIAVVTCGRWIGFT